MKPTYSSHSSFRLGACSLRFRNPFSLGLHVAHLQVEPVCRILKNRFLAKKLPLLVLPLNLHRFKLGVDRT